MTLAEDIVKGEAWIGAELNYAGYTVLGDIESLREADRFLDDCIDDVTHTVRPGTLLSGQTGAMLFALGALVGNAVIRRHGGRWETDDTDPQGEFTAAVVLPDGTRLQPMLRAANRLREGKMNSIYPYAVWLETRWQYEESPAAGPEDGSPG